jgi:hypothetical protein
MLAPRWAPSPGKLHTTHGTDLRLVIGRVWGSAHRRGLEGVLLTDGTLIETPTWVVVGVGEWHP